MADGSTSSPQADSTSSPPGELDSTISSTAQGPATVSIDGSTVTQQRIADQIAADKYLASKAAVRHAHRGLRFQKVVNPGT